MHSKAGARIPAHLRDLFERIGGAGTLGTHLVYQVRVAYPDGMRGGLLWQTLEG